MKNLNRYVLLLYMYLWALNAEHCPNKCVCKRTPQRDAPEWVKIRCGDLEKLSYVEDDDFLNIANEVVQLNISNNHLTNFSPKVQFVALQKLDISKNELSIIQANQFREIPNLRRLDLSENQIKSIDLAAFTNLKHLERLKLNQNQIITIFIGTFVPLTTLKQLDISNNPLRCDCELLWLLDWADKLSVKLMSNPKCETPPTFSGKPLRKLKVGEEYHCKSPAKNREMPLVKLSPNHSQVVFEGDSLKLQCRVPSMTDSFDIFESETKDRVEWSWLDANPRFHFDDINIENRYLADTGFIDSSLSISKLNRNHSGVWNCQLISQQGNHSKGITIVVISDETKYCQIASTNNNKGTYTWPRTVVNNTVTLPCESVQLTSDISEQKTSHFCSMQGHWKNLNTTKCPYTSETTKILEQFSKVNLTLAKGSILESAKHFKNYTSDLKLMRDVMDLVFIARTLQNYLRYLNEESELSALLMDISNHLIDLDANYLRSSEVEDKSCTKILNAIETIAFGLQFTPNSLLQKSNIAVENFVVKKESFHGLTCTWYVNVLDDSDRLFHCVTYNPSASSATQDRQIEASIQIPESLFEQLEEQDLITFPTPSLLIAMFGNSKLFPIQYDGGHEEVTSAVVGVKLRNITVTNLTEPIYIMLRPLQQYTNALLTPPTPVWWNPALNSNNGAWSSDGCQLTQELKENIVFSCKQLSYYALIQDTSHIPHTQSGAKFKFSHPAIYIGSAILFTCLLSTILTYLLSYPAIQMPTKTKHSLMNTWFTLSLLNFMYLIGIYQTEDVHICRSVGLSLHYLSLSSLLWMCVGVNSMYKRLRKSDSHQVDADELPSDEVIQKPILGLYLVGYGIGLIVCGISGAVNLKEYAAHTHCFLNSAPALSALYIPSVILFCVLSVFFMLIKCAIYSTDTNGHLSEGTQATENVDLDLLEPNCAQFDSRSVRSVSTKTTSSELEDVEHAPMAQLKAYVIFLFIYLGAWLCLAFATLKPLKIAYEEEFFSISFAIFASLLGLFTFFFYCIARNDVRTQWVLTLRWFKRKSYLRSRNVSDAQAQIQIQPPLPEVLNVLSRSSSRSSAHTKSLSHQSNSNVFKDLNVTHEPIATKINNVNLVVLHRQQYRATATIPNLIENPTHAEMFYNPHQSTVARKFFKKQKKRHMLKHNNLKTLPRRSDLSENGSIMQFPLKRDLLKGNAARQKQDNSSVDTSMFTTNAKVNNKNIHVEKAHTKNQDLNMLSDDSSAPKFNKRKMRTVSQQCTLDYSSDAGLSDSILDLKSPQNVENTQIGDNFNSNQAKNNAIAHKFELSSIQDSFTNTELSETVASMRRENSPIENSALTDATYYHTNAENMSILTKQPQFYTHTSGNYMQKILNTKTYEASKPHNPYKANLPFESSDSMYESTQLAPNIAYDPNLVYDDAYAPSQMGISIIDSASELTNDFNEPTIYVNPAHDLFVPKRAQSRASSVSASEIEELYQQIKRGPKSKHGGSQRFVDEARGRTQRGGASPCLSDSEVQTGVAYSRCKFNKQGDKDETTV